MGGLAASDAMALSFEQDWPVFAGKSIPFDGPAPQAATCGRCRAELGEAGRVCGHCRLDERWLAWELRLFSLQSRALAAGAAVSAEDALRQVGLTFLYEFQVLRQRPDAL